MLAVSCGLNIHVIDMETPRSPVVADCETEDNACTDPQWSPDGASLLIYRAMEFRPDPGIYVLDTGCLDDPATCPAKPQFFPRGTAPFACSPTGDKIAFITFDGRLGIASSEGSVL